MALSWSRSTSHSKQVEVVIDWVEWVNCKAKISYCDFLLTAVIFYFQRQHCSCRYRRLFLRYGPLYLQHLFAHMFTSVHIHTHLVIILLNILSRVQHPLLVGATIRLFGWYRVWSIKDLSLKVNREHISTIMELEHTPTRPTEEGRIIVLDEPPYQDESGEASLFKRRWTNASSSSQLPRGSSQKNEAGGERKASVDLDRISKLAGLRRFRTSECF